MKPLMTVCISGEDYDADVVVDSVVNNTSSGGIRIAEDVTLAEVQTLAREMTLKFSFFQLPRGGAKTGLRVRKGTSRPRFREILTEFGRRLAPMIRAGIYYPGMDMNCGPDEICLVYQGAGFSIVEPTDTSYFTAIGVASCVRAFASELLVETRPLLVAIEGFGRVAKHLIERLPAERYKITAISTIEGAVASSQGFSRSVLSEAKESFGDSLIHHVDGEEIGKKEVFASNVDILIPSSRPWVITEKVAARIQAGAIIPIANAPYTEDALSILESRGIACAPGFMSNAGGVLGSGMYDSGLSKLEVERAFKQYYEPMVQRLIRKSRTRKYAAWRIATEIAETLRVQRQAHPYGEGRVKKVYRRLAKKHVPGTIRRRLVWREYQSRIEAIERALERPAKP